MAGYKTPLLYDLGCRRPQAPCLAKNEVGTCVWGTLQYPISGPLVIARERRERVSFKFDREAFFA